MAIALGKPHELGRHPGIIVLTQLQIGERVIAVCVEAGGNEQQVGRKMAERRKNDGDVPEADGTIQLVGGESVGERGVGQGQQREQKLVTRVAPAAEDGSATPNEMTSRDRT